MTLPRTKLERREFIEDLGRSEWFRQRESPMRMLLDLAKQLLVEADAKDEEIRKLKLAAGIEG